MGDTKTVDFGDIRIILEMAQIVPKNNIYAINNAKEIVWRIGDVIKLSRPESYISLSKRNNDEIKIVSISGISYIINVYSKEIVSRQITK